jgi:hypothetical protein
MSQVLDLIEKNSGFDVVIVGGVWDSETITKNIKETLVIRSEPFSRNMQ